MDVGRGSPRVLVPFPLSHPAYTLSTKPHSGSHVVLVADRRILGKSYARSTKTKGPRPRSRTLTAVHEAVLEVRPWSLSALVLFI